VNPTPSPAAKELTLSPLRAFLFPRYGARRASRHNDVAGTAGREIRTGGSTRRTQMDITKETSDEKKIRFYSGGGPRNGRQHTSIAHRERRRILLNKRLMSFNWHRIPRFENQRLARF
jgi:hypothetical protein